MGEGEPVCTPKAGIWALGLPRKDHLPQASRFIFLSLEFLSCKRGLIKPALTGSFREGRDVVLNLSAMGQVFVTPVCDRGHNKGLLVEELMYTGCLVNCRRVCRWKDRLGDKGNIHSLSISSPGQGRPALSWVPWGGRLRCGPGDEWGGVWGWRVHSKGRGLTPGSAGPACRGGSSVCSSHS